MEEPWSIRKDKEERSGASLSCLTEPLGAGESLTLLENILCVAATPTRCINSNPELSRLLSQGSKSLLKWFRCAEVRELSRSCEQLVQRGAGGHAQRGPARGGCRLAANPAAFGRRNALPELFDMEEDVVVWLVQGAVLVLPPPPPSVSPSVSLPAEIPYRLMPGASVRAVPHPRLRREQSPLGRSHHRFRLGELVSVFSLRAD